MISQTKNYLTKLACAILAMAMSNSVLSQQSAQDLVGQMLTVSMSLNYSGVFSYESVGAKRNVKVSHQVLDGHAYERILYLDGVPKDRLRKSLVKNCAFGNSSREFNLQEYYQFNILGEYRVAGRQAYRVQAMPLDKLRYGYQFGVDQQTGLMLQSTLLNQSGQPLEKFKYVDIELEPSPVDSSDIRYLNKFNQIKTETCIEDEQELTRLIPVKWVAKWVPPGFYRSSQRFIDENRVSLFYTDGISVFSVLIDDSPEKLDYGRLSARVGPTQMMTANYRHNGRDYRITVSGQMPQSTVNRIVLSVRPLAFGQSNPKDSTGQ